MGKNRINGNKLSDFIPEMIETNIKIDVPFYVEILNEKIQCVLTTKLIVNTVIYFMILTPEADYFYFKIGKEPIEPTKINGVDEEHVNLKTNRDTNVNTQIQGKSVEAELIEKTTTQDPKSSSTSLHSSINTTKLRNMTRSSLNHMKLLGISVIGILLIVVSVSITSTLYCNEIIVNETRIEAINAHEKAFTSILDIGNSIRNLYLTTLEVPGASEYIQELEETISREVYNLKDMHILEENWNKLDCALWKKANDKEVAYLDFSLEPPEIRKLTLLNAANKYLAAANNFLLQKDQEKQLKEIISNGFSSFSDYFEESNVKLQQCIIDEVVYSKEVFIFIIVIGLGTFIVALFVIIYLLYAIRQTAISSWNLVRSSIGSSVIELKSNILQRFDLLDIPPNPLLLSSETIRGSSHKLKIGYMKYLFLVVLTMIIGLGYFYLLHNFQNTILEENVIRRINTLFIAHSYEDRVMKLEFWTRESSLLNTKYSITTLLNEAYKFKYPLMELDNSQKWLKLLQIQVNSGNDLNFLEEEKEILYNNFETTDYFVSYGLYKAINMLLIDSFYYSTVISFEEFLSYLHVGSHLLEIVENLIEIAIENTNELYQKTKNSLLTKNIILALITLTILGALYIRFIIRERFILSMQNRCFSIITR